MNTDTLTPATQRHQPTLFKSFFQGSFACSTACRDEGKRVDLVVNSGHDTLLNKDYAQLAAENLLTARDGARWYLIEKQPGEYDWSTFLPMLHAAKKHEIEMIWELAHFGWPSGLDIWQPEFIDRFAAFARAAACLMRDEGFDAPFITPMNQISFWSWAGGDVAWFNPGVTGRGRELKQQLVRASLAAMRAIREELPAAKFVLTDPLVHVATAEHSDASQQNARQQHEAQFEAWDMLCGRLQPELGGDLSLFDVVGVTWYPDNQWYITGEPLEPHQPEYRSLASLLEEIWQRYQRPLLIAETGAEGDKRVPWLKYVVEQTSAALDKSVQVEGISLFPAVDYPAWADARRSPGGLFGLPDANGNRTIYEPYALEIRSQLIKMKQADRPSSSESSPE
ncbi:beta-glucosidase [Erwinia sp. MMLR14_017]|uniref:beta-glucosidase n=1 Tax=Erwinia sp. MMLR14_017 TaxID=3093842 RepID=UPI00298F8F93|nr:beta-glucosidase [Erwinia sp. MMLR14_017]MDW8846640.1 beta-glucosidase [Erwinia sp. MMLR14_017]